MTNRRAGSARCRVIHLAVLAVFLTALLHGRESRSLFFDRIVPKDRGGQSFPTVHCLFQDREGFIWSTSPYGLARFDGYSFSFFRHGDDDPGSVADDHLFNVFEDSRGRLWVTSDKGLDLLDRETGRFQHFRHDPADPRSLSSDRIRAISEDRTGALWIGTVDGGVNRMDPSRREFTRFLHDPADPNSPGSDAVWALCCARDGRIWAGATEFGLDCYDPGSGVWSHFPFQSVEPGGPSDWHFWSIKEGRDGRIWVGTNQGGLNWLDPSTGEFHRLRLREEDSRRWDYRILALCEDRDGTLWIGTDQAGLFRLEPDSEAPVPISTGPEHDGRLGHGTVMSIIEDREGLLWFGTPDGISILNKKRFRFPALRADPAAKEGLSDSEVLSLYEDREGIVWIGTAKGGLNRWDRGTGSWSLESLNPEFLELMTKVRIQAITEDEQGDLWFGTSSGLFRYFKMRGRFVRYRNLTSAPSLLPSSHIKVLARGNPGFLWVGTHDGGFFEWDINEEKARLFPEIMGDGLPNSQIDAIHVDRRGEVWIGTHWRGIVRFDPESLRWQEYRRRPEDLESLASSTVLAVAEDRSGRIWVGTQAGPCLFDPEEERWTRLTDTFPLSQGPVAAIVPDEEGSLWMSSEENLVRMWPDSGRVRTYGPEDGLQGGRFSIGAAIRCRDGEIIFGGAAGINCFLPSDITDNPYLPPVAVTSIGVSSPPETVLLLEAPETLDIPKSRFPVTVFISALSYSHPERNRYRVRMTAPEDRVFDLGTDRTLRLDSLRPGPNRFVFSVANHDGVWNPESLALTIRVTVPFWQSWLWRTVLAGLVAGMLWLWFNRRRRLSHGRLLHQIGEDLEPFHARFDLTKREQEVLGLILQGKSNRDIEDKLSISNKTVKNHIYNLYQKIGVKSRLEVANAVRDFARKNHPHGGR